MSRSSDVPEKERATDLGDLVFGPREEEDDTAGATTVAVEAGRAAADDPAPRLDPRPTVIRRPQGPAADPEETSEPDRHPTPPPLPASALPSDDPVPEAEAEEEDGRARIGIVGGRGVGKSYLFQSMVYRTQAGDRSGALTYFLERDSIELTSSSGRTGRPRRENLEEFLRSYESWERLEPTRIELQRWYRLRLGYRCGLFGRRRASLDLEFLDGSGEGFFEAPLTPDHLEIWRDGFLGVEVMVFCLPLWSVFPRADLSDAEWEEREDRLSGFQRVVGNFAQVRAEAGSREPVRTVLALTMADDGRSALETLRERWIAPYQRRTREILRTLRKSSGVARYLANARRISEALREELREAPEARIARLPSQLDLGAGEPWIVPLSAIDGDRLAVTEDDPTAVQARLRLDPPVPLHVELPLLVALCGRANALM